MHEHLARWGEVLPLGHQGEHLARRILFPIGPWVDTYGPGTIRLLHQRQEDLHPYPVTVTLSEDGRMVIWDVTASDTDQACRYGKAELRYYVGDALVKSDVWKTAVLPSLGPPVTEAPEAGMDWIAELLEATGTAQDQMAQAQAVEAQARAYAAAAGNSATAAGTSATFAAASAAAAESSVNAAVAAAAEAESHASAASDSAAAAAASAASAAAALDGKVDKITGKGLSANDYTDADKAKVDAALTAHQDISGKVDKVTGKGLSTNDYTDADKAKVDAALTAHQDISGKVDKVTGKGLSTNDYTDAEKAKLTGIEAGAQVNPGAATTSTAGLMSATDKVKLDGISSNASGLAAVSLPVTVAGNPVATFTADAAGRTINPLLVNIEPVQAGTGDPSPSNVRAITGWTGVKIARTDSPTLITITPTQAGTGDPSPTNIRDITGISLPEAGTVYGGTLDVVKGVLTVTYGAVTIDGNSTVSQYTTWSNTTHIYSTYFSSGAATGMYINQVGVTSVSDQYDWFPYDTQYEGKPSFYSIRNDDTVAFAFCFRNASSILIKDARYSSDAAGLKTYLTQNPLHIVYQLETPIVYSLTPAQVETALSALGYNGNAWSISFPASAGTVYGGTLDAAKGILTVTQKGVDVGSLNWQKNTRIDPTYDYFYVDLDDALTSSAVSLTDPCQAPPASLCSYYSWAYGPDGVSGGGNNTNEYWINNNKSLRARPFGVENISASDFKTLVTGQTILYTLQTPVTYALTPAQVTTLLGANNVWADCGAVTVTYYPGTAAPVLTRDDMDAAGGVVSLATFQAKIQELTDAIVALAQEGGT